MKKYKLNKKKPALVPVTNKSLPSYKNKDQSQNRSNFFPITLTQLASVLPLLIAIGAVPLVVLLNVESIPTEYQNYWMTSHVFDFFSYYKAQMVVFCAGFTIFNVAYRYARGNLQLNSNTIWLPLLIYLFFVLYSTFNSDHLQISLYGFFERYEGMWVLLSYAVLMIGAYILANDSTQVKLILAVWGGSLLVISSIGVFQMFGFDFFRTIKGRVLILPDKYAAMASSLEFNFPLNYVYSTLYNPNNVACMMALALPVFSSCLILFRNSNYRIGIVALLILLGTVLIGTRARGAAIAAGLGLIVLFVIYKYQQSTNFPKRKLKVYSIGFTLILFSLLSAGIYRSVDIDWKLRDNNDSSLSAQAVNGSFAEKLITTYGKYGSGRIYIWVRSLEMASSTFFLGRGADTFPLYFPNTDEYKKHFYVKPEEFIDKPHNQYIQNWLNIGGLATLSLLAMLFLHSASSLKALCHAKQCDDTFILGAGLFAGWLSYLIAALFYDSVVSVAPTFWIVFGLGISMNERIQQLNVQKPLA